MPYMIITTNADDVMGRLERALDDFDLESPANGGVLGDVIVHELAGNIIARAESGRGADSQWPRNTAYTVSVKGFDEPNHESGQMLSRESVEGEHPIRGTEMTWTYGTGAASTSDPRKGRDATDRAKAERAHGGKDGQGKPGIERHFFDLDDQDRLIARDIVAESLGEHLKAAL